MKVVQIRVYRGLRLSYNSDGTPQNENQLVTLTEGLELDKFMKSINTLGYCKVELVSVKQKVGKSGYKDSNESEHKKFAILVKEAFEGKEPEKVLTVADLAKRMDELDAENKRLAQENADIATENEELKKPKE